MRPRARLHHVRQHGLAEVEGAGQVDPQVVLPQLGGDVAEAGVARGQAGIVDQDARRAELATHGFDGGQHLLPLAHVDRYGQRRGPRGGDTGGGLGRRRFVEVEHGHGVPVGGQSLADGQPDPRGTARDDGHPLLAH